MPTHRQLADDFSLLVTDQKVGLEEVHGAGHISLREVDNRVFTRVVGTGDGATTNYTFDLGVPLRPTTLSLFLLSGTVGPAQDDGDGAFNPTVGLSAASAIIYDTGSIDITFTVPPAVGDDIYLTYQSDSAELAPRFPVFLSGTVEFQNWVPSNVTELFGFETVEIHNYALQYVGTSFVFDPVPVPLLDANRSSPPTTSIGYQVSTDDGVTWQYVNAGVWTVGDDTDSTFSSATNIDALISQLSFSAPPARFQIKIRARLFPDSSGVFTPLLRGFQLNYEAVQNSSETDFVISVKRFLDANLQVPEILDFPDQVGVTVLNLALTDDDTEVPSDQVRFIAPARVYNVTNDPGETTAIVGTLSGTHNQVLTLPAAETGRLKIYVNATIPIFIGQVDEFHQVSVTRAVIIDIDTVSELDEFDGQPGIKYERELTQSRFRVRPKDDFLAFDATFRCQAQRERRAQSIAGAIRRLLNKTQIFASVISGDEITMNQNPITTDARVIGEGLAVKDVSTIFWGCFQESGDDFDTAPVVTEALFRIRDASIIPADPTPLRENFVVTESDIR